MHYLEKMDELIRLADSIDLLVIDTMTGLQGLAIREVKGRKQFEMNQRKWGQVSSRVIECIAETRNFPKDVIYLIQEKKKSNADEADEIHPALSPATMGYLSSNVDWIGRLSLDSESKRFMDFRITDTLEVKDRAGIFPKLIANPSYLGIRKRIQIELGATNGRED